jgi:hypothetical protein
MTKKALALSLIVIFLPSLLLAQGKTREQKVRDDRKKVEADGFWIYNDLPRAFAEARRSGKPMLVVLRCIPCEECVKLDDDLVDQDPTIRPLLEEFVCVRQVSTNGLDLNVFQFDTDQSFAVFLLNSAGTIYGRFGTRSHRTDWLGDVSLDGLAKALRGALALHEQFPRDRALLQGKRGQPMEFASPELYPSLKGKFTDRLRYEGDVVRSCIHCHQIGDAQRDYYRKEGKPIPEKVLFPFPHPKETLGLVLDPREMATVKDVVSGSVADAAGLRPGDRIETVNQQPILSVADVQWVLHGIEPSGGRIPMRILRNGQTISLTLAVPDGWRRRGDLSWRVTSWGLRRMATGGLLLEAIPDHERTRNQISDGSMALEVKHVGQHGAHATGKNAGFRKGDIVVQFDGRTDLLSETDVLRYGTTERKPGVAVQVVVLREGNRETLQLPMQY